MVIVAPSKVAFQDWNDIPGLLFSYVVRLKGF